MAIRKKHIALLLLLMGIAGAWLAAPLLPALVARHQGAEIVRPYPEREDYPSFRWEAMPCLMGDRLVVDIGTDGTHWVIDTIQGERVERLALDAGFDLRALHSRCNKSQGKRLDLAWVPRGRGAQVKWRDYGAGAVQPSTFALPDPGERGSYRVEDWNDQWVLLDQWVSGKDTTRAGVGLLNLQSGQFTVPVSTEQGKVYGGILVDNGYVYISGDEIYYAELGGNSPGQAAAPRKIGKRGWYLFTAQGSTVAWVTQEQPHQVVLHDLKTGQEWKLDGIYPFLAGDWVIRTVPIGAAGPDDKPSGAEIVVSLRDGSQRRVLARTAKYDTQAVYYEGKLYYLDQVPNQSYPLELVYYLLEEVLRGTSYDYDELGTNKYLFAKRVNLDQP